MGALGDLGWYCTYNILWAFNFELPTSVWGRATFDPESGSIIDCTAELFFSKNRSANFNCSFINVSRQTTELVSTKEWIRVDGYVLPQENEPYLWQRDSYEPRAKYTVTDGLGIAKVIQLEACDQVKNLFKQFASDCASENITSARKWSENSINVTKVLQSIFESVNEDGRTVFLSGMATPKDVIMVSQ
jgi:predicted dehydrogenase